MKFESFLTKTKGFLIKRITELFGFAIILIALFIFIALISYSPNDPNFIINNSFEVKNILGFKGSVSADFLFQSIGLISYLIPMTFFFSGLNILLNKKQLLILDNLFFLYNIYTLWYFIFFLL